MVLTFIAVAVLFAGALFVLGPEGSERAGGRS